MLDLLLPLGSGSKWDNNELRYMLRSLKEHCTGWRTLWIVGERPDWLVEDDRVRFMPIPDRAGIPKDARIAWKQIHAMERIPEMLEDIVLLNDDYVFTKPTDLSKIKPFRRKESLYTAGADRYDGYGDVLKATHHYLTRYGFPRFHYDVHMPCRINRERYLLMLQQWTDSASSKTGYVVRSLYHNYQRSPADIVEDRKLGPKTTPEKIRETAASRWVFSYGDEAIKLGLSEWLASAFPNPSPWEKS